MKNSTLEILQNFANSQKENYLQFESILNSLNLLIKTYKKGRKLLLCGNGGSAADCSHFMGELVKSFEKPRILTEEDKRKFITYGSLGDELQYGLPVLDLTVNHSLISAIANDGNWNNVFAQQVWVLGGPIDTLIGFSTSGNSENIVRAAKVAKAKGMKVIAFVGNRTDSQLPKYADVTVFTRSARTYLVQESHLPLYHMLCLCLENEFFA